MLIYFWLLWVFIAVCRLSLIVVSRACSGCSTKLLTVVASPVADPSAGAPRLP